MFGNQKLSILAWSVISSVFLFTSCDQSTSTVKSTTFSGEAQGTTYSIIIVGDSIKVTKFQIDSILTDFDNALSTYNPNSSITRLNESKDSISITDSFGYLGHCYDLSQEVYAETDGAFDPSVFPLIKGYGFMDDKQTPIEKRDIDSILNFVSFENQIHHSFDWSNSNVNYVKNDSRFKLDFNAIAQGYSVDVLVDYLTDGGYENFYVEIGGEIRVHGKNREGEDWKIGVDFPIEDVDRREIENVLHLSNRAVATSGNYRKFYTVEGKKYSHTIDPSTGSPVTHNLLSATVIAGTAAEADAYATAFMVMGAEKSLSFIESHPALGIQGYFLVAGQGDEIERLMSKGLAEFLK